MLRLHVITVHHRGEEMFSRCLESLVAQKGVELEIVAVANGEAVALPEIAATSDRVHVVATGRPIGFGEANNLGVRWADEHLGPCDGYYFVNNDTWSEPRSAAALAEALVASPDVGVVGPTLVIWGSEEHLNSLGLNVTEDAWGWDEGIGREVADYGDLPPDRDVLGVTGSAVLVRREVFEAIGGWPEIYEYYFEDIDLCLRSWRLGWRVRHVSSATVRHRISATMSEGSERKELFFWRNRLLLATIHWPIDLLMTLLRRALGPELTEGSPNEVDIRLRAIGSALDLLPEALRLRAELSDGDMGWAARLRPTGSVPVIRLPEACYRDASEVPSEAEDEATDDSDVAGDSVVERSPSVDPDPAPFGAIEADADVVATALRWAGASDSRRVLVVGWGPMPFEAARMHYAPGSRTWQLAELARDCGGRVVVVTARIPGTGDPDPATVFEVQDGIGLIRREEDDLSGEWLARLVAAISPDAVVGATPIPALWAVRAAGTCRVWVDLFGDLMSEGQAKAIGGGAEQVIAYHDLLRPLLLRGDRFTVVSERQRWAAIGQLGLTGRLDASTAGEELVHVLPCSLEAPAQTTPRTAGSDSSASTLRSVVPADAFVVLWSGSYNTWCDVETLFEALELAMDQVPDLHFVSTGGVVEGHDETTYPELVRAAGGSEHRRRYHLRGPVGLDEVEAWTDRADIGVITERVLYERRLGSSQRIARWVAVGLPFVCTSLSELGDAAIRAGLADGYRPSDAGSLAEALIRLAGRRPGRHAPRSEPLLEADVESLQAWLAADSPTSTGTRDSVEDRRAEAFAELEAAYHEVRDELGKIHHSRMWATWMRYYQIIGAVKKMFGRSS